MDRCGAAEGHLVVFDSDTHRSRAEKVFRRAPDRDARIHVWGMQATHRACPRVSASRTGGEFARVGARGWVPNPPDTWYASRRI